MPRLFQPSKYCSSSSELEIKATGQTTRADGAGVQRIFLSVLFASTRSRSRKCDYFITNSYVVSVLLRFPWRDT